MVNVKMICTKCGTKLPDDSKFCPECGTPRPEASAPASGHPFGSVPSFTLSPNVAGALSYISFIPAVVFLALNPYNKNPFVRFHAFQSLFLYGVWLVVHLVFQMFFQIAFLLLGMVGFALMPLQSLVGLVFLILWIVCAVKAYGNEKFKLPILGPLAERQAQKN